VLEADPDGAHLEGSFAMGDGTGRLNGRIDLDASGGPEARVALDADRLQLFDVDWLHLTTTSDLTVALLPERVELNGRVGVDRARLGMPPGAAQAVSVSDDVVVVGREESAEENGEARPPRDIVGQVELSLGDDVRLQAAGMQSRVTGQLGLDWEPGRYKPTAEGSLHLVEGSYRAYGQTLEVTQGDVLFTGRPVDNPVLQIEAVRDIFGDPQVEQAGVRIQGAARDPEIDLFTDPPTNREKALAYILTGAEFDHAAGQGAFNVGFFVLPKLFVSYGVGLFDTGDVLAARYELSRRWGIRATSGERDTGVDVSFIIDR
jgi:translocation and assembly module TamB